MLRATGDDIGPARGSSLGPGDDVVEGEIGTLFAPVTILATEAVAQEHMIAREGDAVALVVFLEADHRWDAEGPRGGMHLHVVARHLMDPALQHRDQRILPGPN